MAKIDVIEERLNNHIKFAWCVIAAIVAAMCFLAVELYRINGHLGELDGLKEKVTTVGLQSQASLPQPEFDKELPNIQSAIAAARKDHISVPPPVIDKLRSKLLASNAEAPDFWPTLSELVSYRSSISYHASAASASTPSIGRLSFKTVPNCVDSPPEPMRIVSTTGFSKGVYENCRFVLDSAAQGQKLNAILRTSTPVIVFQHCLIEYNGGEITLILAWNNAPFTFVVPPQGPENKTPPHFYNLKMTGPAIDFQNCLFILTFQNPPPPNGQRLATALLAENADSVSLPIER
jgi:hypothetical protein